MIARPKRQLTGVVVELRLVDPHHFAPRGRIDYVGIAGGNLPLRDHALMVKGVWVRHRKVRRAVYRLARVSVEPAEARAVRIREARMKGEPEESSLVVAGHERNEPTRDGQKRRCQDLAVL